MGEARHSRAPGTIRLATVKKPVKVLLISVSAVVGLLALGLGSTTVVNAVASAAEESELQSYGQLVPVDGKNLNVVISGDSAETIVLLSGLGTAAPGLDFAPLVAELDDDYRVVVVEPFGYGLSDQTDAPRTSAAIVEEVHEALQTLGIDRYALAGHSIAGIYGLEYVERFRDEVTAFVGIDTSVPNQPGSTGATATEGMDALKRLGLLRLLTSLAPSMYDGLAAYDEAAARQLAILGNRNAMTPTLIDEVDRTPDNFAAASELVFPADLPLLLFVVADDPQVDGWLQLHADQAAHADRGELVPLDGGHYLHHTRSAEIAAATLAFLTR
jgi:pimeloyl-ACP methyl ester carboxylesterase